MQRPTDYLELLSTSAIFAHMSPAEIQQCLSCSEAFVSEFHAEEMIFRAGEVPRFVYVLLSGSVGVVAHNISGKSSLLASFHTPGGLFGEVFAFLPDARYEQNALCQSDTRVLCIPQRFIFEPCGDSCVPHARLTQNMLSILAHKAHFLNKRVQILTSGSLRVRLLHTLALYAHPDGRIQIPFSHEKLAEFVNATRPSVSREMSALIREGVIRKTDGGFLIIVADMFDMH